MSNTGLLSKAARHRRAHSKRTVLSSVAFSAFSHRSPKKSVRKRVCKILQSSMQSHVQNSAESFGRILTPGGLNGTASPRKTKLAVALALVMFSALGVVSQVFSQADQAQVSTLSLQSISRSHKNGRQLAASGQFAEALQEYEKVQSQNYSMELRAELHNDIGAAFLAVGNAKQAERNFRQAIVENPSMVAACNNLEVAQRISSASSATIASSQKTLARYSAQF